VAWLRRSGLCDVAAGVVALILAELILLAVEQIDMRAGTDTVLVRVVGVWSGETAPCLPVCQQAGYAHEGAGL
jgi:hypothetical protein